MIRLQTSCCWVSSRVHPGLMDKNVLFGVELLSRGDDAVGEVARFAFPWKS